MIKFIKFADGFVMGVHREGDSSQVWRAVWGCREVGGDREVGGE